MADKPKERRVQLPADDSNPKRTLSMLASNTDLSQITPEEWNAILLGDKYPCQLLVGGGENRDVILNVNLAGIRLLDPRNEEIISQFDIEQILQYSYSQQNSTFSFSYLEEGRFFVTHKFLTPDFFEIHQYLGNAIAIVIKLKTQMKSSDSQDLTHHVENLKKPSDKLKREGSVRSTRSNGSDIDDSESHSSAAASPGLSPSVSMDSVELERYGSGKKSSGQYLSVDKDKKSKLVEQEGKKRISFDDPSHEEEKKKANIKPTGSMRLKTFSLNEVVSRFDFGTIKKKRPNVNELSDRMRASSVFVEINPEDLPETVTRVNEAGVPVLIRTMQNGKYQITAGTIDALVESLADQNQPDSLYIDVFLQTYRNFMTPALLLKKLRERFELKTMRVLKEEEPTHLSKEQIQQPKKPEFVELDADTIQLVKLRIASVIKKWVERHWYDFEVPEMHDALKEFIELMRQVKLEGISIQINNAIARHKEEAEKRSKAHVQIENRLMKEVDLSEVNPKDIAHHLTIVSVDLLKAIAPDEFVFYIWGKKSNPLTAKLTENLQRLIQRFNKIGFWVATEICACQDLKKRVMMMEKFISVAKYLLKIQNFNDVIAVLSGLQTIPVYRLKKTWQNLAPKFATLFKELEAKMGPEGNYKQYRQIEFEAKPPFIPFFGLYMKDLTFMNDGNQTYLANDMVNLEKHRTIMGAIMAIRSSQQSLYNFEINPNLRKYCEIVYNKEEDELIQESNVLEPSNRQRRASIASMGSEFSANTEDTEGTNTSFSVDGAE